jgi:hypothetical protein
MNLEELNSLISYVKRNPPSGDPIAKFMQELSKPDFEHERKIALFESYLQTLEGYLDQEAQQAKDNIGKIKAEIDEKLEELNQKLKAGRISSEPEVVDRYREETLYHQQYELAYADYWSYTVDEFADTLRKSFFINLYGFWESQLFPLCKALEHYENMPAAGTALDYPERAKKFLKKINVRLGGGSPWCTINNYRLVRNCLAHNNGELERCKEKDRNNITSFILSKQSRLSIKKEGDIFLNTADGVLVRKEKPQFYSKQTFIKMLSESGEIRFKKGDVIRQEENIDVFQEDFTFQKGSQIDSAITINLKTLEEKEQIIFRKGKTVISHIEDDPVNFQKYDAVIFREGSRVIFRQGSIFRSMVVINKEFCEDSLETITQFSEDLRNALTKWALSQTAS